MPITPKGVVRPRDIDPFSYSHHYYVCSEQCFASSFPPLLILLSMKVKSEKIIDFNYVIIIDFSFPFA